jgi:hypothetical protein
LVILSFGDLSCGSAAAYRSSNGKMAKWSNDKIRPNSFGYLFASSTTAVP